MIPGPIIQAVAARMREADAEVNGRILLCEYLTDDALIDGIAARIIELKARGWGQ